MAMAIITILSAGFNDWFAGTLQCDTNPQTNPYFEQAQAAAALSAQKMGIYGGFGSGAVTAPEYGGTAGGSGPQATNAQGVPYSYQFMKTCTGTAGVAGAVNIVLFVFGIILLFFLAFSLIPFVSGAH
jgi:hypothetical protein